MKKNAIIGIVLFLFCVFEYFLFAELNWQNARNYALLEAKLDEIEAKIQNLSSDLTTNATNDEPVSRIEDTESFIAEGGWFSETNVFKVDAQKTQTKRNSH